ncbi:MAG TPA: enoyl-CoA hydratase-related protein, partial [Acidimicrobiia bacterium]|nr:enoyl-CoA hydratase-related protein [Acidimicrobiia bacterium]
ATAHTFAVTAPRRSAGAPAVEVDRPLVITGREGQFCAGFDLAVMGGGDRAAVSALFGDGGRLFADMLAAPVPVVAACTGHALAGGALLLLSADYRVGTVGAYKIGLNEVRIGLALPRSALVIARHRLSTRHLTAATLLAEVGTPDRSVEAGYLDDVATDAVAAARTAAAQFGELPRRAFSVTKRRLREAILAELADCDS